VFYIFVWLLIVGSLSKDDSQDDQPQSADGMAEKSEPARKKKKKSNNQRTSIESELRQESMNSMLALIVPDREGDNHENDPRATGANGANQPRPLTGGASRSNQIQQQTPQPKPLVQGGQMLRVHSSGLPQVHAQQPQGRGQAYAAGGPRAGQQHQGHVRQPPINGCAVCTQYNLPVSRQFWYMHHETSYIHSLFSATVRSPIAASVQLGAFLAGTRLQKRHGLHLAMSCRRLSAHSSRHKYKA
jgi:hypothetical protein